MAGEEIERRVGAAEVVRDAFESIPVLVVALEGPDTVWSRPTAPTAPLPAARTSPAHQVR